MSRIRDLKWALRDLMRASARLRCGVEGYSVGGCVYYDGLKGDAMEETRDALKAAREVIRKPSKV